MTALRTPGFCALCKSRCGALMVTEHGRLVGQEPDPSHPTGAALCVKGRAAAEIAYNPQRQLYPLRRTRPKGDPDPGWQRIGWDEALALVADRLLRLRAESGAQAVAFGITTPSGTPIADDLRWIERLINAFGSPNEASGTEICNWHKDHAHAYTCGRGISSPDFAHSGCVVLWGHNPSATWLDHATATNAARARGAKLIVVDPRRAGFAARADAWLRVRPGADGALALGIAGEMLRHGWFDAGFMRDWSNGPLLVRDDDGLFLRAGDLAEPPPGSLADDLLACAEDGALIAYSAAARTYRGDAVPCLESSARPRGRDGQPLACRSAFALYRAQCEAFTPERVEALCWVPAAQVTATARLLHASGPVSYYGWSGIGQHTNATQTDRAIALLMALTGSFDAPGGNVVFARPPSNDVSGKAWVDAATRARCIGLAHSPLGPGKAGWIGSDMLYDAILDAKPYRLRGLVNFGRNFLVNHAHADRGRQALAALEFFVHADLTLTPTAAFADVFLPINTPWEREALRIGFEGSQAAENRVQLRQAVIPSQGESRSDAELVFALATRLGLGERFWHGDIEAGLRHVLAPTGLTLEQLREQPGGIDLDGRTPYRRYLKDGFATFSGRLEVYSEPFLRAGQPPLPTFAEPAQSPFGEAVGDFPLVLTSAKVVQFCHGQHRDIPSLRKRQPDPELTLHPDTALARGIAEHDWVELRTAQGRVRAKARFDAHLDPRVVCGQYGWWQANTRLGVDGFDAASERGANYNRLVDDGARDPVSGANGLRSQLCEVAPLANAAAWRGWRVFRVARRAAQTADIVSLWLAPEDGEALPAYRGGQFLTLRLADGQGGNLVRCYSLSGPCESGVYRISVKRAEATSGPVSASRRIHALAEGERLEAQAPRGDFCLQSTPAPLVLLAAGIGITPLLSMLHELAAAGWSGPVRLHHGVRGRDERAFADELDALCARLPGLSIVVHLSREAPAAADERAGRLTAEALPPHAQGTQYFLCGPGEMVAGLSASLLRRGVPPEALHAEAFGPSSRSPLPASRGPQPVLLARSGRELRWEPEAGSLLEQLERAGVPAPSGCRTGQCESCAVGLQAGSIAYPDGVCAPPGRCLTCSAIPLEPLVLDL